MSLIEPVQYPHPAPYLSSEGCKVCGMPPAWLSIYTGRRCETHKPTYSADTAVEILMAGWPGTAASYVRSWAA